MGPLVASTPPPRRVARWLTIGAGRAPRVAGDAMAGAGVEGAAGEAVPPSRGADAGDRRARRERSRGAAGSGAREPGRARSARLRAVAAATGTDATSSAPQPMSDRPRRSGPAGVAWPAAARGTCTSTSITATSNATASRIATGPRAPRPTRPSGGRAGPRSRPRGTSSSSDCVRRPERPSTAGWKRPPTVAGAEPGESRYRPVPTRRPIPATPSGWPSAIEWRPA